MSSRRFRSAKISQVKITRAAYETLMAFSLSRFEFYAICGANAKNVIVEVVRVPNRSNNPSITYWWDDDDWRRAFRRLEKRGLHYFADCHSHPRKDSKLRPSVLDHRWSVSGGIELIIKSSSQEMGAWRMGNKYKESLNGKIELVVV